VTTTSTVGKTEITKVWFVKFRLPEAKGGSSRTKGVLPFTLHVPQGRELCDSGTVIQVSFLVDILGYPLYNSDCAE
jgi:hypothetical protein